MITKLESFKIKNIKECIDNIVGRDISKISRLRDVVEGRYCFYKIVKDNYQSVSLNIIGSFVGGKDHASVLNGLRKFDELIRYKDFTCLYNRCLEESINFISITQSDIDKLFLENVKNKIKDIYDVPVLEELIENCNQRIKVLRG